MTGAGGGDAADGAADRGVVPGEEIRLIAPLQGTVAHLPVPVGAEVSAGTIVVVLESMKMEHVVRSPVAGTLAYLDVEPGGLVSEGTPLAIVEAGPPVVHEPSTAEEIDPGAVRPDLAELFARRHLLSDVGAPTWWRAVMDTAAGRHARTSPTCAIRGVSPSTAASPSPRSGAGGTKPT